MALITDLPSNASPATSDYMITDNGTTTSKTTIANLGMVAGKDLGTSNTSSTTFSLNIPNNSRHLLLLTAVTSNYHMAVMASANSSGSIFYFVLGSQSSISVASSTNTLTFTKSSASVAVRVYDILLLGSKVSFN